MTVLNILLATGLGLTIGVLIGVLIGLWRR